MRMLIVEDNERLAGRLKDGLARAGYPADVVDTQTDAVEALAGMNYEAVALDLGLPDEDGLSLLRAMRTRGDPTPVLVITARGSLADRVAGLDAGADDYLVKPFALEEMIARLKALARRPAALSGPAVRLGNLTFDIGTRQVYVGTTPCVLTRRELAILEGLLRRKGRIVSKQLLEDDLYGLSDEVESNAIEVHVCRLRKRLAELGAMLRIDTLRGLGYTIVEQH
jgi:DNA-binding response OmpR family regulator